MTPAIHAWMFLCRTIRKQTKLTFLSFETYFKVKELMLILTIFHYYEMLGHLYFRNLRWTSNNLAAFSYEQFSPDRKCHFRNQYNYKFQKQLHLISDGQNNVKKNSKRVNFRTVTIFSVILVLPRFTIPNDVEDGRLYCLNIHTIGIIPWKGNLKSCPKVR